MNVNSVVVIYEFDLFYVEYFNVNKYEEAMGLGTQICYISKTIAMGEKVEVAVYDRTHNEFLVSRIPVDRKATYYQKYYWT
jgi:hypothetical protein